MPDLERASYTLRFPFELDPGHLITDRPEPQIPDIAEPTVYQSGNLTFRLTRDGSHYALYVDGFESEEAANDYVNHVWAGLLWVSLKLHIGLRIEARAKPTLGTVSYATDPYESARVLSEAYGVPMEGKVDGLANDVPIIYPSDKSLRFVRTEASAVLTSSATDQYFPALMEGASFQNAEAIKSNSKLCLALELFISSYFERSANSRFLTLVMALESLIEDQPRPEIVVELLEQWRAQTKELKESKANLVDREALETLERGLHFKEVMSKRSVIKALVCRTLMQDGETESAANDIGECAKKVYDQRGILVHVGELPPDVLNTAWNDAVDIVSRVLLARIREVSGQTESPQI